MSRKLRSRRLPEKQALYAVQGIAIGVIASLVFISGGIIIVQINAKTHICYALPFGFVLFITVIVVMVYRLWRVEVEPEQTAQNQRSLLHDPAFEISANAEYTSEAIRRHKESVKTLLDSLRAPR
jgi:TRAP-type C4-dicarboxylate transport system permease small subunit